jgi:hypothetical protein
MEGTTNKILAAIGTERLLGMVHQWFTGRLAAGHVRLKGE